MIFTIEVPDDYFDGVQVKMNGESEQSVEKTMVQRFNEKDNPGFYYEITIKKGVREGDYLRSVWCGEEE